MYIEKIIKQVYSDIKASDYKVNCGRPAELLEILKNGTYYNAVYNALSDSESKADFEWLIQFKCAYSILNNPDAHSMYPAKISRKKWKEHEEMVSGMDGVILSDLRDAVETYAIDTYGIPGVFEAEEGDVILDGGAYTGNTSFKFAEGVGPNGHIHAFEAEPNNYNELSKNIEKRNSTNISVHEYALTSSEQKLKFSGDGIGAKIGSEGIEVQGNSIDNLVNKLNIKKVDMIKLDVEGAEYSVITGAKNTIKQYTPKLAISVYHKADDIYKLTKAIYKINRNYRIYFRADTKDLSNLIMFFVPCKKARNKELATMAADSLFKDDNEFLYGYLFKVINFMNDKKHRLIKKINRMQNDIDKMSSELNIED